MDIMVAPSCDETASNVCKGAYSRYSVDGAITTSSIILLFIYKLLLLLTVANLPQFQMKKSSRFYSGLT